MHSRLKYKIIEIQDYLVYHAHPLDETDTKKIGCLILQLFELACTKKIASSGSCRTLIDNGVPTRNLLGTCGLRIMRYYIFVNVCDLT